MLVLLGTGARPAAAADKVTFADARSILAEHCYKCHGERRQKGGINFAKLADDKSALKARKALLTSLEQVRALEMPPESEEPLSEHQRETLLTWLQQTVNSVDSGPPNPGPSIVRRLSRVEYENTIRDLVGLPFDASQAVGMPDDVPVHGYSNLANALVLPPALMEKYVAAADRILGSLYDPAAAAPDARPKADAAAAALVAAPPGLAGRDAASHVARRFAGRAYRRPASDEEAARLLALYDKARAGGESHDNALRYVFKAVLISPKFLLRIERDQAPADSDEGYRVTDYELASRLSYFLWASMPDDELFRLAGEKRLSDPAVLERQARRMLADPKARALTDVFAAQWLQIRKLPDARPGLESFPSFTLDLRRSMYEETATFFDKLREEDRSILDLLDASYTYLDEDLARHYGIEGVVGPEMRRVELPAGSVRGGLLGMASVLSITSQTSRTSPTLRGKWILEVVLGTPPPPPPANVGALEDQKKGSRDPKSFRELMAAHAAQPACASCHSRIDPLGFGLEDFDPIGRYRVDTGGQDVDNTGKLPTGETFTGPAGLKKVVIGKKDQFVRNVTEQMLTYALGREIEYYDERAVRDARGALEAADMKFSGLVLGVVRSYPFQHRRNTDATVE